MKQIYLYADEITRTLKNSYTDELALLQTEDRDQTLSTYGWIQEEEKLRCICCHRILPKELLEDPEFEFCPKEAHFKHCLYVDEASQVVRDLTNRKLEFTPKPVPEATLEFTPEVDLEYQKM